MRTQKNVQLDFRNKTKVAFDCNVLKEQKERLKNWKKSRNMSKTSYTINERYIMIGWKAFNEIKDTLKKHFANILKMYNVS